MEIEYTNFVGTVLLFKILGVENAQIAFQAMEQE